MIPNERQRTKVTRSLPRDLMAGEYSPQKPIDRSKFGELDRFICVRPLINVSRLEHAVRKFILIGLESLSGRFQIRARVCYLSPGLLDSAPREARPQQAIVPAIDSFPCATLLIVPANNIGPACTSTQTPAGTRKRAAKVDWSSSARRNNKTAKLISAALEFCPCL